MEMSEKELIEQLADKEHDGWSGWMAHLIGECEAVEGTDGHSHLCIPKESLDRWERQIRTPYKELSEQEKQSDRDEVAHILPIIEAYKSGASKDITIDRGLFEHLLNCMCNQKFLPTSDTPMSDREKEMQKVIDKAYHQARDLLSSTE